MITVNLMGRLGNNLFQLATCLSLANKNNTKAYYCKNESNINVLELPDIQYTSSNAPNVFSEKKFNYNEEFENLTDNTHLHGYFQSEKYFKNCKDLILKNFSFKEYVKQNVKTNGYSDIENITNQYTAIHIRRTDYLTIQHAHPICSREYYINCLNEISPSGKILIFSDDLNWCKENFIGDQYVHVNLDHHCCLYMMTKVKNIVIANSSFSWWGAWLNNRQDKKVYAPKQWFGDTLPYRSADINLTNCLKDLYCEGWNVR
jgi:hypothetical protein